MYVQRRQSGLKSGGSWIQVKKSIFPGKFPKKFYFFRQFQKTISICSGKFRENFAIFWQFEKKSIF